MDILPVSEQERYVYPQQLRTEILLGEGPDGYLLPTVNSLILDEPVLYTSRLKAGSAHRGQKKKNDLPIYFGADLQP